MRYKRHHKKSNKRLKVRKHRHVQAPKGSNHCGHKNDDLKLSDRVWVCPHCGKVVIRDYNALRNILEEGIRLLREELGDDYIVTHICVLKTQIDDKCSQSTRLGEVGSSSPNPAGIDRWKDCGETVRHCRVRPTAHASKLTRSSKREEIVISSDSHNRIAYTDVPVSAKIVLKFKRVSIIFY